MISTTENLSAVLQLPPLEFGPISQSLGHVYCVLNEGGVKNISAIGEIQISPRCKENLYTLSDGQTIIVTKRTKVQRPDNIDGVLRVDDIGRSKWLSHKALEKFKYDVDTTQNPQNRAEREC